MVYAYFSKLFLLDSVSAKQLLSNCIVLGLLQGAIISASASEYEVDGLIEQTIYEPDGSAGTPRKSQFTVFVKDCSWLIRTTQSDTNGKPVSASETACVNGTEIYQVSGPVDGGNAVIGQNPRFLNQALVFSNNCPIGRTEGYFVCHIWMMFASGCAFQNLVTNWLTPVYDSNASADVRPDLKLKAKWELIGGPGSLPRNVLYYRYYDEHQTNYNKIEATYTATGVTNAGTIKIPSGFVFEWRNNLLGYVAPYGSVPRQPTTPYRLRKQAVGTVTAVRPYCSRKDLTPNAKGKTMVIDMRPWQEPLSKASRTNITYYVVQDGVQWLPFTKAKKAYVVPQAPPKPPSRRIVAILLFLPTAGFLLFLWLNRKKG